MSFKRKLKREKNKDFIKHIKRFVAQQEELGGNIIQKENGDVSWVSDWESSDGFFSEEQGEEI